MADSYDHKEIEAKWQAEWAKSGIYRAAEKDESENKAKFYCLVEFPFPSGDGLHVGHIRSYTALDILARKRRMMGQNVLYPMGWDAFGLPTENYAIKTGKAPALVTQENTDNFRQQLQSLGFSFDWSREINTTDPEYYKWTQWLFLQFYQRGLAYKQKTLINWCPKDKIGLANEEVVEGKCERCGTGVEQKEKEQWMLAITKYADRLDKDLDDVDYLEKIKIQQRNWIGKRDGAVIEFKSSSGGQNIEIFTTRPETIFGATYLAMAGKEDKFTGQYAINPATGEQIPIWEAEYVLADVGTGALMGVPAHDERDFAFAQKHGLEIREVVIPNLVDWKRNPPIEGKKTIERQNVQAIVKNPKTGKYLAFYSQTQDWYTFPMGGVEKGEDVIQAARREIIEESGYINLSDGKVIGGQVRSQYFAKHKDENRISNVNLVYFELLDEQAVPREDGDVGEICWIDQKDINPDFMVHTEMAVWTDRLFNPPHAWIGEGVLINSGEFNGLTTEEARKVMTVKFGTPKTTYKLRDWVFSRQRYWGEPIPMIHCEKCGWQAVPESDLPVILPEVENYQPRDDGESPLASVTDWVKTKCPKCGGEARRETDTMPNWAGSSWYYLRYCDPKNAQAFASTEKLNYWLDVDWYNGGMEHTTLHLLYSRFWHKFLFDLKLVPNPEPYHKRTSHGLILAEGGVKMSKSKPETIINPDKIVTLYGADTLRIYEMFMGPFEQAVAWNTESIIGPRRFLERVWKLSDNLADKKVGENFAKTVEKITDDIENLKFNTAISGLMILLNSFEKSGVSREDYETFLKLLAPFAPHITEELWQKLGNQSSIHTEKWPETAKNQGNTDSREMVKIVIQVNGVVRDILEVSSDADEEIVKKMALQSHKVEKWLDNKKVEKVVYVPRRLLNFVIYDNI